MVTVSTARRAGLGQVQVEPLRTGYLRQGADAASFGGGQARTAALFARAAGEVGDAGDRIVDLGIKLDRQQQVVDADRASVDAQLAWHDLYRQMESEAGAGAPGFTERVRAEFDKFREGALKRFEGKDIASARLSGDLAQLGIRYGDRAAEYQEKAQVAHASTQLKAAAQGRMSLILLDPDSYGDQLQQQLATVEESNLPPDKKAELGLELTNSFAFAHWKGRMQSDPAGVAQIMRTEANLGLDFKTRLDLLGDAEALVKQRDSEERENIRFQWAQQAEAERRSDRAREENGALLTAGVLAGNVGLKQIESAVRNRQMSASEGRTLASLLKERSDDAASGPKRDDPVMLARLYDMQREDPEAVRAEALKARQSGSITTATLKDLLNDKPDDREERFAVKDARAQIGKSLKPEGLMAVLDEDQAERIVQAENVFREQMKADPKADPYRVAQEVIRTYKGGDVPVSALPTPRFLVGSVEQPDIEASIAALEAAKSAGEIDDVTLAVEGRALERVFEAAAKRKPSP